MNFIQPRYADLGSPINMDLVVTVVKRNEKSALCAWQYSIGFFTTEGRCYYWGYKDERDHNAEYDSLLDKILPCTSYG